jgi:hypothetical protein
MTVDMADMMALVPLANVTDTANVSGNWSNPSTWQSGHVPASGANVEVPAGVILTVDGVISPTINTIRVDGTLAFSTTTSNSLTVGTLVTNAGSDYQQEITNSAITSTVTFADNGAIQSTAADPHALREGLMIGGSAEITGAPVADYKTAGRNITYKSAATAHQDFGHIMFMHTDALTLSWFEVDNMGRTDKSLPINDPSFDANGNWIPGTGTNPRGRYALHFHRDGIDASCAFNVTGIYLNGGPGWGLVNHSSNVNVSQSYSTNFVGSDFVTEAGNEVGSFTNCTATNATGYANEPKDEGNAFRVNDPIGDFGFSGNGFWFQGPGLTVSNDEADNCADSGFFWINTGLNEKVLGKCLFNGKPCDTIGDGTISNLTANNDFDGINIWRTNEHGDTPSTATTTLQNSTVYHMQHFGMQIYGNSYTTVSCCIVTSQNKIGNGIDFGGPAANSADETASSDTVTGCYVGLDFSVFGNNVVDGGSYTNHYNFKAPAQGPSLSLNPVGGVDTDTINSNVTLGHLAGDSGYKDLWMDYDGKFPLPASAPSNGMNAYFNPGGTVMFMGQQVWWTQQAVNFVPFPSGSPSWVPSQHIGLTNQQLHDTYAVEIGGSLAPSNAVQPFNIIGLEVPRRTPL